MTEDKAKDDDKAGNYQGMSHCQHDAKKNVKSPIMECSAYVIGGDKINKS